MRAAALTASLRRRGCSLANAPSMPCEPREEEATVDDEDEVVVPLSEAELAALAVEGDDDGWQDEDDF
jgi:hypothetical protein